MLRFLLTLLMLFYTGSANAQASDVLAERACVLGTSANISLASARARDADFICNGEQRFSSRADRVWVRADMSDSPLRSTRVELQADNLAMDGVHIHAVFADGSVKSVRYSPDDIRDSSRPKARYGLPVPTADAPLQTLYVATDRPWAATSVKLLKLVPRAVADSGHLPGMTMFAMLCGLTMAPIIYNCFFYFALRYKFMLLHSVAVASTVAYSFSSSGLIFIAFPDATLEIRHLLNYWSLAVGVAAGTIFTLFFLEKNSIGPWIRRALWMAAIFMVMATAIILHGGESMRIVGREYYHAAFLPVFAVNIAAMAVALYRGSRAVKFQIAAWIPILAFALDRVFRGMDIYHGYPVLDYGLYFALMMESLIIALGVADRIMTLRHSHQKSLRQQAELTRLADTDGLTGLLNRRGFDKMLAQEQSGGEFSHIAMVDIDNFKQVNDSFGHDTGDAVLRIIGRNLIHRDIVAARIGGDEFVLFVAQNSRDDAQSTLEKLSERITRQIACEAEQIDTGVTLSIGIAPIMKGTPIQSNLALADQRLYNAKKAGRNLVMGGNSKAIAAA